MKCRTRPIRGQASQDEADALRDEGIDFSPLPPFLTRDRIDARATRVSGATR